MSMKLKVQSGGLSDTGRKRANNEDNILVSDELGLYAVADGMGGHAAGEIASEAAIKAISEFVEKAKRDPDLTWPVSLRADYSHEENLLNTAVTIANRQVCRLSDQDALLGGMGTTLALIYVSDNSVLLCHVGDSRIYRWRKGRLDVMTQDHSWVKEQVKRNMISEEEARQHRWRNVITRALGSRDDVEPDLKTVDAEPGDLFLICSDGLNTMIDDATIAESLESSNGSLTEKCSRLVGLANEAGGLDNISVILVRIES